MCQTSLGVSATRHFVFAGERLSTKCGGDVRPACWSTRKSVTDTQTRPRFGLRDFGETCRGIHSPVCVERFRARPHGEMAITDHRREEGGGVREGCSERERR